MSGYCERHEHYSQRPTSSGSEVQFTQDHLLLTRKLLQAGVATGVKVSIVSPQGKRPLSLRTRPGSASGLDHQLGKAEPLAASQSCLDFTVNGNKFVGRDLSGG